MVHKCSYMDVMAVFFEEPTTVHFIKEISRRIGLAPTSVRNHVKYILREGLIKKKASRPFDGFVANRESEKFIFSKRAYNLGSVESLAHFLTKEHYPKLMVLFGSYSTGEDVEGSDVDIFIMSKIRKELDVRKFETSLKRKIHIILLDDVGKLDKSIQKKIHNGIVLYGGF